MFTGMAPISTPAVILHAFRYGESSKIVRLLTRSHGLQSGIAKGAMRPKSRFGARLQVLSEGVAQLYLKPHRDLQTLAEFDVTVQRATLARGVKRYAAGTALAELVLRFAPSEPHPEIYDLVVAGLDHLAAVPDDRLDVAALKLLWTAVAALGFAPSVGECARCGAIVPVGAVTFSVGDGGFLCRRCAAGRPSRTLEPDDRAVLERLISGTEEPESPLPPKHAAAHRRLLVEFIERHVAEGRELTGVGFWAGLS
jgi:DNA repair protein RecO (recombination protein O)